MQHGCRRGGGCPISGAMPVEIPNKAARRAVPGKAGAGPGTGAMNEAQDGPGAGDSGHGAGFPGAILALAVANPRLAALQQESG